MMIVMNPNATEEQTAKVCERLRSLGFDIHRSAGRSYTVLGAIGDPKAVDRRQFEVMEGVKEVLKISEPYKLAGRSLHPVDSVLTIRGSTIGGPGVAIMAGPCSVESKEQLNTISRAVMGSGATFLRGGAYKPRTSPYAFQGLGQEGLEMLREQADKLGGVPVVSEIMDARQLPGCVGKVDVIQIGARNMQNFELLKECGRTGIPVLLKRGMSSTIEEWLMAAEYVMSEGNKQVILCERGIRTFETATRNTLDLSAIPVVKEKTHLPVIVDPSHAMGRRDKILPMARAAVAAGADGLIVEVHHDPDNALSDGPQALLPRHVPANDGGVRRDRARHRTRADHPPERGASRLMPALFRSALVVGTGLMGTSFALALKRRGLATLIAGCEPHDEARQAAEARGAFAFIEPDLVKALRSTGELVILAAPPRAVLEMLLDGRAQRSRAGRLVIDLASTKRAIVVARREGLSRTRRRPSSADTPCAARRRVGRAPRTPSSTRARLSRSALRRSRPTSRSRSAHDLVTALGARPLLSTRPRTTRPSPVVSLPAPRRGRGRAGLGRDARSRARRAARGTRLPLDDARLRGRPAPVDPGPARQSRRSRSPP